VILSRSSASLIGFFGPAPFWYLGRRGYSLGFFYVAVLLRPSDSLCSVVSFAAFWSDHDVGMAFLVLSVFTLSAILFVAFLVEFLLFFISMILLAFFFSLCSIFSFSLLCGGDIWSPLLILLALP